ncbi:hypothetical protein [Mucilaginibacter sp. 21P]|uniref:hypothetical protein n=1 Tax=Mucilaginibacter sp. 21P TaxID=2778902 RepID=UPI001C599CCB|nr:hypothetical protein [Mucilaginibacter sp. 21P]
MLLLFVILTAGAFMFYFYSYKSNSLFATGACVAMAIGFTGLGLNWFSLRGNLHRVLEIASWVVYLLIGVGLFATLLTLKGQRETRVLKAHGVKVKAIIISKGSTYSRGSSSKWAIVQYVYGDKTYLQDIADRPNYNVNDTVKMVCLPNDPELARPLW